MSSNVFVDKILADFKVRKSPGAIEIQQTIYNKWRFGKTKGNTIKYTLGLSRYTTLYVYIFYIHICLRFGSMFFFFNLPIWVHYGRHYHDSGASAGIVFIRYYVLGSQWFFLQLRNYQLRHVNHGISTTSTGFRDFLPSSSVFGKMSSHINISCQEFLFNKTLVVEGT